MLLPNPQKNELKNVFAIVLAFKKINKPNFTFQNEILKTLSLHLWKCWNELLECWYNSSYLRIYHCDL